MKMTWLGIRWKFDFIVVKNTFTSIKPKYRDHTTFKEILLSSVMNTHQKNPTMTASKVSFWGHLKTYSTATLLFWHKSQIRCAIADLIYQLTKLKKLDKYFLI